MFGIFSPFKAMSLQTIAVLLLSSIVSLAGTYYVGKFIGHQDGYADREAEVVEATKNALEGIVAAKDEWASKQLAMSEQLAAEVLEQAKAETVAATDEAARLQKRLEVSNSEYRRIKEKTEKLLAAAPASSSDVYCIDDDWVRQLDATLSGN